MKLSDLNTRVVTAISLIATVVVIFFAAELYCFGRWMAVVVTFVAVGMSAYEFANVCATIESFRGKKILYFLILLLPAATFLLLLSRHGLCELSDQQAAAYAVTLCAGAFLASLVGTVLAIIMGSRGLDRTIEVCREIFCGLNLVGFGGAALLSLLYFQSGVRALIWLILVVCINDTSAYLFGTKVRGPRLAPVISPNKTISGSAAGFICGIASGALFSFLLPFDLALTTLFLISAIVVAAAQIGDLTKSYIKRMYSVKDSGTILPGHGGFLDRIDGLLGAGPILLFLYLIQIFL